MNSIIRIWGKESSGEGMGRHSLLCCPREIIGGTPESAISWKAVLLCLEDTEINISDDWLDPIFSHETQLLWQSFWSQQLTPFIVFPSGGDNSIRGFIGLHVHQIHKAPRGSTTKRNQKSMKSFPEGIMTDLGSKTLFASVDHWYRKRAACCQPLSLEVL